MDERTDDEKSMVVYTKNERCMINHNSKEKQDELWMSRYLGETLPSH